MKYFLDTNICIYFLKGMYPALLNQFQTKRPDDIKIASIVKAELLLGAFKSDKPRKTEAIVSEFLLPYSVIAFNDEAAVKYARIRGALEKQGQVIGANDLILAATVLANDGILITNNNTEFKRVKSLKVENWIK